MVQGEGPQGRPGGAGAGAPEAPPRASAGGLQGVGGGSGAQPRRAGRPSQRTEVR